MSHFASYSRSYVSTEIKKKRTVKLNMHIYNQKLRERADLCVVFSCIFVTFPYGVLGQVMYLIVSIPFLPSSLLCLCITFGCFVDFKLGLHMASF